MPNYQNSKIYRLVNDELNLTYYGSTTQSLSKRLNGHNETNNKCKSKLLYVNNYKPIIVLVENYPCSSKEELLKRERYYIENNECVNGVVPYISKIEYIEKRKKYYQDNREEKIEKVKQYKLKNKEKFLEYSKQYYDDNKATLCDKNKETTKCLCGSILRKRDIPRHNKTKKQQNFINSI